MAIRQSDSPIFVAVRDAAAAPIPESDQRPVGELLLAHVGQRLDAARGALWGCFHTGRPTLTAMKERGLRIPVGSARPPGDGRLEEFRHGADGPLQYNVFGDQGADGLLWMTSIGVGDFEFVKIEGDRQGWCANRLAFCLEAHACMVERDIAEMAESGEDADRPALTWDGLSSNPSEFMFRRTMNVRSKCFADYMQVQTFWYPRQP